jgi:hypothetical protein
MSLAYYTQVEKNYEDSTIYSDVDYFPIRTSSLVIPIILRNNVILQLKTVDRRSIQRFQQITDWANHIFQESNQAYTCTLKMTMFVCIELFSVHDYNMMYTDSTYFNTPYHLFEFNNYEDSEYFLMCIINY